MTARARIEVDSLEAFDTLVAEGASSMRGWELQDLDLRGREDALTRLDPRGALFLGCRLPEPSVAGLHAGGALLFPALPKVPFDAYRTQLYSPTELYDGLSGGYDKTLDARIYRWSRRASTLHDTVATALHDNTIDDALAEYVGGRQIVGVMGGHDLDRADPWYAEAARLGRLIAEAGLTVATGGGPGAMEAANLGARFAGETRALAGAIQELCAVPTFEGQISEWAGAAIRVEVPDTGNSLGVPTWFYGQEPPNAFASSIAKYFRNSVREDQLLHLARAGVVFLAGSAGTVQEIFQSSCENYYADHDGVAPMVLVGREYWTKRLPAWQLLGALGSGRPFASRLHLVDHADEVLPSLLLEG